MKYQDVLLRSDQRPGSHFKLILNILIICLVMSLPSGKACSPQELDNNVKNIHLNISDNYSSVDLMLECKREVDQSLGGARVLISIRGKILRTPQHGSAVITTVYNLKTNLSLVGTNLTFWCVYRFHEQQMSSAQNHTFNCTKFYFTTAVPQTPTDVVETTNYSIPRQSVKELVGLILVIVLVIVLVIGLVITIIGTSVYLGLKIRRNRRNNDPERSNGPQHVHQEKNDSTPNEPIACTETSNDSVDIVRGDGESVHRCGFSQPVKVYIQVYAKEKIVDTAQSDDVQCTDVLSKLEVQPCLADQLSKESVDFNELDLGSDKSNSLPSTTSSIPRNGNADNLRRRFNQRKTTCIMVDGVTKMLHSENSMRRFYVTYENEMNNPEMGNEEDHHCFSTAERESCYTPISSIVMPTNKLVLDDSASEELSDYRKITLPSRSRVAVKNPGESFDSDRQIMIEA